MKWDFKKNWNLVWEMWPSWTPWKQRVKDALINDANWAQFLINQALFENDLKEEDLLYRIGMI